MIIEIGAVGAERVLQRKVAKQKHAGSKPSSTDRQEQARVVDLMKNKTSALAANRREHLHLEHGEGEEHRRRVPDQRIEVPMVFEGRPRASLDGGPGTLSQQRLAPQHEVKGWEATLSPGRSLQNLFNISALMGQGRGSEQKQPANSE